MFIYCDESGGFDGSKHGLIVSAVNISVHDSSRLMKQFRKATKLTDEIKGGLLNDLQRSLFFDMLAKLEHASVVVSCMSASALGAWAKNNHSEHLIYENMLTEACCAVEQAKNIFNIVADGGRYQRQTYDGIAASIKDRLSSGASIAKVEFVRSENSPGVQVADIISNTVYKATKSGSLDLSAHPACGDLATAGRLKIISAQLDILKPSWLAAE